MSRLAALKAAQDLASFAKILNYHPKGLSYILYKVPLDAQYESFLIPKKGGGHRHIDAPKARLGLLQRRLADLLNACVKEIEDAEPHRRSVSHGFHSDRSIVTNARSHRKQRFILNLDLQDFFGSINFGRVRGFFIADNHFKLSAPVATVIAQIACYKNKLPQGSPCSPIISNLIGNILDARLVKISKSHKVYYTRYADDLTFSTRLRTFPPKLAKKDLRHAYRWKLGRAIVDEVEGAGFALNQQKQRMQLSGSQQEVTGLIVNEIVNVSQHYYRDTRSMCHELFKTGGYYLSKDGTGKASEKTSRLAPLEGRLAHIYYVKARRDRSEEEKKLSEFEMPNAVIGLYRKFLFYKYFVANERPLIITEGKSDITYLRAAAQSLHPAYPLLVGGERGRFSLNVSFLTPSYIKQTVLGLGSGTGKMTGFIVEYQKNIQRYHHRPLAAPVIILVDNDEGAKEVFSKASRVAGHEITIRTAGNMFHLVSNLYLVKTPVMEIRHTSCIEDSFTQDVLARQVDGKPFDPKKKHGDESAYGKIVFAERVVRPNAHAIDFAGFHPLLTALSGAVTDYAARGAQLQEPAVAA
jgi:RNA-directed DNA polymerase